MKLITKISYWTYIRVITTALNDQNHISENCIGSVIFDWSPIRLHGEGGVYDLYCSQPPGGDQIACRFTFPDMWGTPASIHVNSLTTFNLLKERKNTS